MHHWSAVADAKWCIIAPRTANGVIGHGQVVTRQTVMHHSSWNSITTGKTTHVRNCELLMQYRYHPLRQSHLKVILRVFFVQTTIESRVVLWIRKIVNFLRLKFFVFYWHRSSFWSILSWTDPHRLSIIILTRGISTPTRRSSWRASGQFYEVTQSLTLVRPSSGEWL